MFALLPGPLAVLVNHFLFSFSWGACAFRSEAANQLLPAPPPAPQKKRNQQGVRARAGEKKTARKVITVAGPGSEKRPNGTASMVGLVGTASWAPALASRSRLRILPLTPTCKSRSADCYVLPDPLCARQAFVPARSCFFQIRTPTFFSRLVWQTAEPKVGCVFFFILFSTISNQFHKSYFVLYLNSFLKSRAWGAPN